MHTLLQDAIEIYRQDGPKEVLDRAIGRLRRKYLIHVRLGLVPPLPPIRVNYTVEGVTASFAVTTPRELRRFLTPVGITEAPIHRDLIGSLRPDDVFYDVGANIGIYSCLAAAVLRDGDGHVAAFEPLRSNVEKLERNAELNGGRIDVYDVALSDENATRAFDVSGDGEAGEGQSRIAPDAGSGDGDAGDADADGRPGEGGGDERIRTRRGDDFVSERGLAPPSVVKIDVEGAEMAVIRGMWELLESEACRLVYCEVHARAEWDEDGDSDHPDLRSFGDEPGDVREALEGMGYDVERVLDRDTPVPKGYLLRAERPA